MGRLGKDAWDVGKGPLLPCCNTIVSGLDSMNVSDGERSGKDSFEICLYFSTQIYATNKA